MRTPIGKLEFESIRQWMPIVTLVVLIALVGAFQPDFLEPATLLDLASDTAVLFVLATGVTFVIMVGGIDLSIQSMASLASVIVALTLSRWGYAAFAFAIAAGILVGFLSGLAHVRLKVPSFIATLAMGGVLFSAALVLSKERSITLQTSERDYQTWITGSLLGVPNVVVIAFVVLAVAHTIQSRTRFGRYSAAIGAGEAAAYASGVKVDRQKIIALILSGDLRRLGRRDSRRAPRQRLADLGERAPPALDRRGHRRRHGDHRRRREHLAHLDRGPDHFGGPHRHDLRRRRYLRPKHRFRRGSDRCGRRHHRPVENTDRQVERRHERMARF